MPCSSLPLGADIGVWRPLAVDAEPHVPAGAHRLAARGREQAERQRADRGAIAGERDFSGVDPRAEGQQHRHLLAAAARLARPHAGASEALDLVLVHRAVLREPAEIAPGHARRCGAEIARRAHAEQLAAGDFFAQARGRVRAARLQEAAHPVERVGGVRLDAGAVADRAHARQRRGCFRHMSAALRPPDQLGSEHIQQLDIRHAADGEADRVAGDGSLRAGRVHQHRGRHTIRAALGRHTIRAALGRQDRVPVEQFYAGRGEAVAQRRRCLRRLAHLYHRGDFAAVIEGECGGCESEWSAAEHHHTPAGERAVADQQRVQRLGAHDTRQFRAGETEHEIARTGRDHEFGEAAQPGMLDIGQPDHRPGECRERRAGAPRPPGAGAEAHIDAEIVGGREVGAGREHLFQHPRRVLHRGGGAAAEQERDVHADLRRRDRVFVEKDHGSPGPCARERRYDAGRAGADHEQVGPFGEREVRE